MTLHLETLESAARAALTEATGAWREGSVETHNIFAQDPDALGPERVLLALNRHFPHKALAGYLAMLHPEAVLELVARIDSAGRRLAEEVSRLENEVINATLVADPLRSSTKSAASTESLLMRYIDNAKKAAGKERVTGEPLADFITRILEELRALRAEVGS